MAVDFTFLRVEVADFLGLGRATWSGDDTARLASIVNAGYRQFLSPIPAGGPPHHWSFLRPVTTLAVLAGTADYVCPSGFVALLGDMTFAAVDGRYHTVRQVGEQDVRAYRQISNRTGPPLWVAIQPQAPTGVAQQTFKFLLDPTPDGVCTLSYRYLLHPVDLDAVNTVPAGGDVYGDTILESCLAVAEQRRNGEAGIHTALYQQRLAASIEVDRQVPTEFIGYCGDGSGSVEWSRVGTATYKGLYSD
jgi:hypothetical protein